MAIIDDNVLGTIYEDVEDLQNRVLALENLTTAQQSVIEALVNDSGWVNLPLSEGIIVYDDNSIPQYRKIGNKVFLRGGVKGVNADYTVIGVLPEGFRPVYAYPVVQNTSKSGGFAQFYRLSIGTDGKVEMMVTSRSHASEAWYPINACFVID